MPLFLFYLPYRGAGNQISKAGKALPQIARSPACRCAGAAENLHVIEAKGLMFFAQKD